MGHRDYTVQLLNIERLTVTVSRAKHNLRPKSSNFGETKEGEKILPWFQHPPTCPPPPFPSSEPHAYASVPQTRREGHPALAPYHSALSP